MSKKKSIKVLVFLYLVLITISVRAENFKLKGLVLEFEAGEIPQSIVYGHSKKTVYVLTQKNIYTLENNKLSKYYSAEHSIYCGYSNDSSLWIGTDSGVEIIRIKDKFHYKIVLDSVVKSYKVISIFSNNKDSVFLATDAYGIYKGRSSQSFEKVSTLFPINKGINTADSSIWIATDVGLFRNKKNEWIRYNEEGVANFEIPDNIVQNLIVDEFGFLWVLMRDGVCVIEVKDYRQKNAHHNEEEHGHLPSVEFIGYRDNTIYDLAYFKNNGYVFTTDKGVLWMPLKSDEELLESFHHGHEEKVGNKELLIKLNTSDINKAIGKILFLVQNKKTTCFIGEKGSYLLEGKDMKELLSTK